MVLDTPFNVHIEKQVQDLAAAMNEIRSWLDNHGIQPAAFKTSREWGDGIAVDIGFRTEDEAYLFSKAFP